MIHPLAAHWDTSMEIRLSLRGAPKRFGSFSVVTNVAGVTVSSNALLTITPLVVVKLSCNRWIKQL